MTMPAHAPKPLRAASMLTTMFAVAVLAGCGGGGGSGGGTAPPPPAAPAPPPGPSYTLSGTITAADVSTVDGDTNDPNQTGFVPNDTPLSAQRLSSPVTVVGAVNLVGAGPVAGRNFMVGDREDWFRVQLKAGQVVELLVGLSETARNDADLCVVSTDATSLGCSVSTTERECVRATADGEYFVVVDEFDSSSVYNLRISAPGAGVPCSTLAGPASAHVPGQLLAQRGAADAPRQRTLSALQGSGARVQKSSSALALDIIDLPPDEQGRAQLMSALRGTAPGAATRAGSKRTLGASARESLSAADAAEAAAVRSQIALWRAAKTLRAQSGYTAVEPNWLMDRQAATVGLFPPSDTRYSSQRWHYEQISLPSAMQALNAMAVQPTVRPIVAVLDDGVMLDHPDLAPQLLNRGRAFASVTTAGDNDRTEGESLARGSDDSFHGTHVAGTAVAATFDSGANSFGSGVAPMALLLPVRVFRPDDRASSLDVAEGILYASRIANRSGTLPPRRADVINLSLGSSSYVPCPSVYQTAINSARNAGVIVVAAAGNSGRNDLGTAARVSAPANCTGVLAVAATDALRRQTRYSNSGDEVALTAPGGDGQQRSNGSGTPDSVFSAWGAFDGAGVRRANFIGIDGTSMAAPHVAGVMALMRWVNPALTPAQLDALLQSGQLTDELGAAGKDSVHGWGLVNARKAVDAALGSLGGIGTPALTPVLASPSTLDFGTAGTQLTLRLAAPGNSTEAVTGVTSDSTAVTVLAGTTNAQGQGEYTVRVNRTSLAAGSYFPRLTVQVTPTRSFTVQLAFGIAATGSVASGGNVGPLYVLVYNPDTDAVREARAVLANGRYTWQLTGYTGTRAILAAGSDLDADDIICQAAEVCGGYPVLATDDAMTVTLDGNRSDLDFSVAPRTDVSNAALRIPAGVPAPATLAPRWKRPVSPALPR